jgi:hypothetical protein
MPAIVARFAGPGKPRVLVVLAATRADILKVGGLQTEQLSLTVCQMKGIK